MRKKCDITMKTTRVHSTKASYKENGLPEAEVEFPVSSNLKTSSTRHEENDADDDEVVPDHHLPSLAAWNNSWSAAFHTVTATVAAGVLALPTAMAYLGWGGGTVVLTLSWLITLFTLWQMVEMHEMVPGERNNTYHKLGQKAFGKTLGLWIVLPQQLIVQTGVNVVYMVTGGQALWQCYQLLHCKNKLSDPMAIRDGQCCGKLGPAAFVVFFAIPQFFLAQLGNFDSIVFVSLAASVTCIGYSTIAWIDSVSKGISNHSNSTPPVDYCVTDYGDPPTSDANQIFGLFSALGVVAFTYSSHNVVLEIQATLPSTPSRPSKIDMWRGVKIAYLVVAICYFPVAFAGYWAFGSRLPLLGAAQAGRGNILMQLGTPRWLIAVADLMLVIHLTGSYQVYAVPVFDMMEKVLTPKFSLQSKSLMRFVTRSTYVFFTGFIACSFPFFTDIIAFFGGIAFTPSTYFLPCLLWLKLKGRESSRTVWLINWLLIVIGVLLSFAATIGGLREIIIDASKYRQYIYQFTCKSTHITNCTHIRFRNFSSTSH